MKKFARILALSLAFVMLLSFVSCSNMKKEETFTTKEVLTSAEENDSERENYAVMSITLNGKFKKHKALASIGNYSALFDSSDCKVLVINRDIDYYRYDASMTTEEYAAIQAAGADYSYPVEVDETTGLVSYRYNTKLFGAKLTGICYVFRYNNDFWLVDMVCKHEKYDEMSEYFKAWANSVSFTDVPMTEYILED